MSSNTCHEPRNVGPRRPRSNSRSRAGSRLQRPLPQRLLNRVHRPSSGTTGSLQEADAEETFMPFTGLAKALVSYALDDIFQEEVVHDIDLDSLSDWDANSDQDIDMEEVVDLVEEQEMQWLDAVLDDVDLLDQSEAVPVEFLDGWSASDDALDFMAQVDASVEDAMAKEDSLEPAPEPEVEPAQDDLAMSGVTSAGLLALSARAFMLTEKPPAGGVADESSETSHVKSHERVPVCSPSSRQRRTVYGAVMRPAAISDAHAADDFTWSSVSIPSLQCTAPRSSSRGDGKRVKKTSPDASAVAFAPPAFKMDVGDLTPAAAHDGNLAHSYEALHASFFSLSGPEDEVVGSQAMSDFCQRSLSPADLLQMSVPPGQSRSLVPSTSRHDDQPCKPGSPSAPLAAVKQPPSLLRQSSAGRVSAMMLDLELPSPTGPLGAVRPPASTQTKGSAIRVSSVPSLQACVVRETGGFSLSKSNKQSHSTGLLPPLKASPSMSFRSASPSTVNWTSSDLHIGARRRGVMF